MMKSILNNLKNNKYFSLFFALMLTFAYMGGTRKYIYDNCSKIFDFARMGSGWFNLSIGIAILMAVAICLGVAITLLLRKKITLDIAILGYGVAGIISILTLLFTPYNLQLLSPNTQSDALATVTLIAVMVFGLITTIILSSAISAHVLIVLQNNNLIAFIVICVSIVFSTILSSVVVAFNLSLQIYIGVLTLLLIIFNAINAVTKSEREDNICVKELTINWLYVGIILAVAILAIIAILTSSCIVVENSIKF